MTGNQIVNLRHRGRQLEILFQQRRPETHSKLVQARRLVAELTEADRYFTDRSAFHNEEYIAQHPRPNDDSARLRWLQSREAYVEGEIQREMLNWVTSYPALNQAARA